MSKPERGQRQRPAAAAQPASPCASPRRWRGRACARAGRPSAGSPRAASASTAKCSRAPPATSRASDRILVDGNPLPAAEPPRLWRYHKPKGLVTTHADPQGRPTVFDALPEHLPRVVSVGRLDFNTEGLLLLTNDGALARHLELPATGWMRRYRVRAHGSITQAALDRLKDGIELAGVRYGPIEATLDKAAGQQRLADRRPARRQEPRGAQDPGPPRPHREPPDPHLVRAVPAARSGARRRRAREAPRADRAARASRAAASWASPASDEDRAKPRRRRAGKPASREGPRGLGA